MRETIKRNPAPTTLGLEEDKPTSTEGLFGDTPIISAPKPFQPAPTQPAPTPEVAATESTRIDDLIAEDASERERLAEIDSREDAKFQSFVDSGIRNSDGMISDKITKLLARPEIISPGTYLANIALLKPAMSSSVAAMVDDTHALHRRLMDQYQEHVREGRLTGNLDNHPKWKQALGDAEAKLTGLLRQTLQKFAGVAEQEAAAAAEQARLDEIAERNDLLGLEGTDELDDTPIIDIAPPPATVPDIPVEDTPIEDIPDPVPTDGGTIPDEELDIPEDIEQPTELEDFDPDIDVEDFLPDGQDTVDPDTAADVEEAAQAAALEGLQELLDSVLGDLEGSVEEENIFRTEAQNRQQAAQAALFELLESGQGEATADQLAAISGLAESEIESARSDTDVALGLALDRLREEDAAGRGLRFSDTPIFQEAEDVTAQSEQLFADLVGTIRDEESSATLAAGQQNLMNEIKQSQLELDRIGIEAETAQQSFEESRELQERTTKFAQDLISALPDQTTLNVEDLSNALQNDQWRKEFDQAVKDNDRNMVLSLLSGVGDIAGLF